MNSLHFELRRLNPVEAEVWLRPRQGSIATVRISGPRCAYATTVEIAFPLLTASGAPAGTRRLVIPEPSLWDPTTPFLYGGQVLVRHDDGKVEQVQLQFGLRVQSLTPRGLKVNGQAFALSAVSWDQDDPQALGALRQAGVNTLLVPATPGRRGLWRFASRLGFFVIGVVVDVQEWRALQAEVEHEPSRFAWKVSSADLDAVRLQGELGGAYLGMEVDEARRRPDLAGLNFVFGSEELASLPLLAVGDAATTPALGRLRPVD